MAYLLESDPKLSETFKLGRAAKVRMRAPMNKSHMNTSQGLK
jgi:hypothetical protein